ncbi:MAG TPA: PspA/IM30 family protein, partial [Oculatellaceae cyanobacterium]
MGLFDRLSRVVRANLNDIVSKAEDPEKVLEQAIIDMGEDLVQLRQAVARAIATQKRTEQQYNKNQTDANGWQSRAQLALQKGDENLAREALVRKKTAADTAAQLKSQLDQQVSQVDTLKRNLIALESKISEAKTKKDMLKSRAAAAKANEQLQSTISGLNTGSAMSA